MEPFEWTDPDAWPVTSERDFSDGGVSCPCGREFTLYWNGGELDQRLCQCGRYYRTEHRAVALVVRSAPDGEMEGRRATCKHFAGSAGVCNACGVEDAR